MRRLQRFLAIPMAATAVACLWLLERQTGQRGLLIGAVLAIGLLVMLLLYGRSQFAGRGRAWGVALGALALVAVGVALVPQRGALAGTAVAGAEPWSEARVASDLQQGKPVFVYFTADWCLTCKVNEAAAIDRAEVRDAFRSAGVKVLAGDWTNGDPAITRFLDSRGRAGVPLYLWYAPGKPVEELSQVLTPAMLISRAQATKR
jgi:thiol:disulfide interchange protein